VLGAFQNECLPNPMSSWYWGLWFFYGDTQILCAYCDVKWASNMDDCKSTLGYVFLLGNGAINLNSKKQTFVVMLSTKAKYMATSQTTR